MGGSHEAHLGSSPWEAHVGAFMGGSSGRLTWKANVGGSDGRLTDSRGSLTWEPLVTSNSNKQKWTKAEKSATAEKAEKRKSWPVGLQKIQFALVSIGISIILELINLLWGIKGTFVNLTLFKKL